jgi:hypothetical protein
MTGVTFLSCGFDERYQARTALADEIKRLDSAHPVLPNYETLSGGLAAVTYLQHEDKVKKWARDAQAALSFLCSRNSTVAAVANNPLFDNGMRTKLASVAKKRGGRYTDARASLWLLDATLEGLDAYSNYRVRGFTPREPAADDWARAMEALRVLCEVRDLGVDIAPSWTFTPWFFIPGDWPERLSAQLEERKKLSRPYKDANYLERRACERFVRSIFFHFDGDVSPILVKQFASMIGWESDRLPACVRRWVTKLRASTRLQSAD